MLPITAPMTDLDTITDPATRTYAKAAEAALCSWAASAPVPPRTCPECKTWAGEVGPGHVVVLGPGMVPHVLIGCQGFWTVDPARLGLPTPTEA